MNSMSNIPPIQVYTNTKTLNFLLYHVMPQCVYTAYYMTPVTSGCTQLPIGRIGCDMDGILMLAEYAKLRKLVNQDIG